jgi:nucleoid-associated protein YgaU
MKYQNFIVGQGRCSRLVWSKLPVVAAIALSLAVTSGCNKKSESASNSRSLGQSVLDVGPNSSMNSARSSSAFDNSSSYGSDLPAAPAPVLAPVAAAPVEMPAAAGRSHTIVRGDTLWSISTRYYGDGKKFREILAANPGLSETKLPVGKTIVIP